MQVSARLAVGLQNTGGCLTTGFCPIFVKNFVNMSHHSSTPHCLLDSRAERSTNAPSEGWKNSEKECTKRFEREGERPRKHPEENRSPLEFRLLDAFLKQTGDPERDLSSFAQGVRVGVGVNMPRVPAIYSRKRRWKLREQEDPEAYKSYEEWGADNKNYASAAELAQAVEEQLVASVKNGQAFRLTEKEARDRYGNKLVVAALGAQVKSGSQDTGDLKIRMLFDGTHGVPVNQNIRVRDQDRSPAAPDVKRVLRQLAKQQGRKFGFKVDVKDAHRLIPVSPLDWHLLACRGTCSGDVYVNTTGTFGVASAAYWWSRVATAAIRGAHYVLGQEHAAWLLLVADDLAVIPTQGRIRETVFLVLVFLLVMGFPLSWGKLAGGETLQWVGYELVLSEASLGLSVSRAQWLEGWYSRLLRDRSVQMQEFQEGLGRAAFVCGALDYDRPFLAPLYAFASRHAPGSVKPLPLYVLVTVEYLLRKIRQRRHCECGRTRASWKEAWRVDAHADEAGVGVGGWWPRANEKGQVETKLSQWFAVRVTPENAPWAFQRDGKAYRVIASLEALGLLLALLAFGPRRELSDTKTVIQVPAFTDNRGNGYVINKLMTTRFPLCTVVMELAAQAEHRRVRMEAQWTPRDRNREADDLSNLRTESFDPENEVKVNLEDQSWFVMPQLLESGQKFHEEKQREALQRKREEKCWGRKRRKKEEKLKFREKW